MPPFQNHVIMVFFLYLLGLAGFALLLPELERGLLERPWMTLLLPLGLAAASYFINRARRDEDHDGFLIYEDRPDAAVTAIDLAG